MTTRPSSIDGNLIVQTSVTRRFTRYSVSSPVWRPARLPETSIRTSSAPTGRGTTRPERGIGVRPVSRNGPVRWTVLLLS